MASQKTSAPAPAPAAPSASTAVAVAPQNDPEIQRRIAVIQDLAAGDSDYAARFVRNAMVVIKKDGNLKNVAPDRIWLALQEVARLKLDVGGTGAYLVPMGGDITVIPSAQGLISLLYRGGRVLKVDCHVVYEKDSFDLSFSPAFVAHRPYLLGDRGAPIGAYCVIQFARQDGTGEEIRHVEWMNVTDIENIRKKSKQANTGPWANDWPEMARKTVIKRACKYAGDKDPSLNYAVELDNKQYEDAEVTSVQSVSPVRQLRGVAGAKARLEAARAATNIQVPAQEAVQEAQPDEPDFETIPQG